ncbi:hypothetical protein FEDK69T_21480 [Flavobacterium enshiense DK69]|uniref:Uncharacterized protein n=1 Tax=Flavobacterium enshiense DK69 TaxID=1107311 RepID=V6SCQ7_9FLAO|nr:hypothetical protein FEDK69T_21480 [Flavobacterium enshiense DK69]KGO97182.1 hypothetical protein Q767_00830 [Flavobacterium enshiense DK69]
MAASDWDPINETFNTCYSEEIKLKKNQIETITLSTEIPEGSGWKIIFFYIGFTQELRKKHKHLNRKHNTVTIIACHKHNPKCSS